MFQLVEVPLGDRGLPALSLSARAGDLTERGGDARQQPSKEYLKRYWEVAPGNLVVNPMWLIGGSIGVSRVRGAVSPDYRVYRTQHLDPRFAHHLLRSQPYFDQYKLLVRAETTFDRRVTKQDFHEMPVLVPPLAEQRAIADYLDAETARIDALIAKKQQLIHLLEERWNAWSGMTLDCGSLVPVRHVTSMRTSGPRGWAERVGEVGNPFVRSANLTQHSIDLRLEELGRVKPPTSPEALRSQIRTGDSLVGITGANTGWVAWAGPAVDGGFVSQHVAILRPNRVDPRWLAYSVASSPARDQLLGGQYGGTKTQLGLHELAELMIRVPSPDEQARRVRLIDAQYHLSMKAVASIRAQVNLVSEHRQALITAAVTGEFQVAGAA